MSGGTPLGNMVIKLGLDSADFGRGAANAKKEIKYLAKEMQANMKISDMAGNGLGKLGTRFDGLTKIISAQEKQVAALQSEYDKSFDKDGNATESTKRLATQLQDANGKLANYKQQLINTAGAYAEMKVKTTGATGAIYKASEKMITTGKQMETVGSAMTKGITVPLLAGAAAVTTAAIKWESDFAGVRKTNDEVVDSTGRVVYSYKDLENGLRGLAKELPASHTEIANVAEAAGQLGIKTENVVGFTKTMIDMGESTNMSSETAATSLARLANITKLPQDKFSNLGSAIVDLGNNFATTESEITEMALRLAGAGSQIGLSQGDILGLSAALSSVGIEAEMGGSAMSKVMINMQVAAKTGLGQMEDLSAKTGMTRRELELMSSNNSKGFKDLADSIGMTTTEMTSIMKASSNLENFAKIAGMSAQDFKKSFEEDAVGAIGKFIEGLGNAESKGTSAIEMLDEMGISEVRLRDSLLRAGNASDLFKDAVGRSNKAFGENVALTNEANKRYETTESKLKMLKNEAVDAAIDLGGPFVDALRSGLEASKPLIKTLGQAAKAFSEMDPKTQQSIIKMLAFTAAAGPLLNITGKATTGVGKLGKGFVELMASMAKKKTMTSAAAGMADGAVKSGIFSKAIGVLTGKTAAMGAAAAGASGTAGVGGLVAGLGAIAVPAAIAVGGVAAVAGALYLGKKAYDDNQLAGEKWGTKVTEEQDKVISKTQEMRDKAGSALSAYQDGVTTNADEVVKANKKITDSIQETIDKEYERQQKAAEKIDNEETRKAAEEQAKRDKRINEQAQRQAQESVDRINQIMKNASDNRRKLSDEEMKFVQQNYASMTDKQLKMAGFSKTERTAIEAAYQADLSKLSSQEISKRAKVVEEGLDKEKKHYDEQAKAIEETFKNNPTARAEAMKRLDEDTKQSTESMIVALAKLNEQNGFSIKYMSRTWEKYGWTVDEVKNAVSRSADTSVKNLDMLAKGTSEADIQWNSMAFDPKTGEVRTNMSDVLKDIASADDGWEQLSFMVKNADLTTNAKEEVAIAMGESGKWNDLWLTEKEMLVDNDKAKLAFYESINDAGMWNQYNVDRKTLGIDNADAIWKLLDSEEKVNRWNGIPVEEKEMLAENTDLLNKLATSGKTLDQWNTLPVEQKKMLADNSDLANKIFSSDEMYNAWIRLPDNYKKMLGDNTDIIEKLNSGEIKLNGYNEINPDLKTLLGDSFNVQQAAANAENALNFYATNNPALKKLLGDSSSTQTAAASGENSLNNYSKNNPIQKILSANSSSTRSAAASGESALNSFQRNNPVQKVLRGNSANVQGAAATGNNSLNTFARNNPVEKVLRANDAASGPASTAQKAVSDFSSGPSVVTKTLKVVADIGGKVAKILGFEKGTNFHLGGPAIVNDQKGPTYKELVIPKGGVPFIPEGRNVLLPNLRRGSKVIKASETKKLIPHYADGIGVPENSSVIRNLRMANQSSETSVKFNVGGENTSILKAIEENSQMTAKLMATLLEFFKGNNRSDKDLALDILKIISRGGR